MHEKWLLRLAADIKHFVSLGNLISPKALSYIDYMEMIIFAYIGLTI